MLICGGRVFDGTGRVFEDHGVLVADGRIAEVAPAAAFEGYAGPRIDSTGGMLLPGLIDCHVHLVLSGEANSAQVEGLSVGRIVLNALANAQAALRGGVTAVRDCGGRDYLEFAVRDAVRLGQFLGPAIHAAGRMICMTGGHGQRIARVADGPHEVVKAVREQLWFGADLIKLVASGGILSLGVNPEDAHYTAEELAAGITEAHRRRAPCAAHAQARDAILDAVRGGIDSIEHGFFLDDVCIEEMLARGTFLVPTLAAVVRIADNAGRGIPQPIVDKAVRALERHRQSLRLFYQAGGKLAMGTDAGTPFNPHGDNARELALMVEAGISPTDALIAATRNGAALGRFDDRGEIAAGRVADLLLVSGDPVHDIAAVADRANHRAVWRGGVPVNGPDA